MKSLYGRDLAYIQAAAFETLARGAAAEIVRILRGAAIEIRRVVDVGCGAGPLTKSLVEAGFEVTGIDPSAELLKMARVAVPAARFVNASAYDARIGACDAVVAFGEPLTYHDSADADNLVLQFFRQAAAVLPPGGMLIFDLIELGEPSLAGRSWSSGADWAVLVETREDQSERLLVRSIETFRRSGSLYRRGQEVHKVRLFDAGAVCSDLASCGFAVESARAYGAQSLPPRRRAFFATRLA